MTTAKDATRLIIVESESLYRDLLAVALPKQAELEVVGTYADGETALRAALTLKPQVAIIGIDLGEGLNGIQVGTRLRRVLPEIGLVLLSSPQNAGLIASIPGNPITKWSYLINKSVNSMNMLRRAIQVAAAQLVDLEQLSYTPPKKHNERFSKLTTRQIEILELIAQGCSNSEVAKKLGLVEKSVENQVGFIYQKLELGQERSAIHPRVKAVLLYLEETRQR